MFLDDLLNGSRFQTSAPLNDLLLFTRRLGVLGRRRHRAGALVARRRRPHRPVPARPAPRRPAARRHAHHDRRGEPPRRPRHRRGRDLHADGARPAAYPGEDRQATLTARARAESPRRHWCTPAPWVTMGSTTTGVSLRDPSPLHRRLKLAGEGALRDLEVKEIDGDREPTDWRRPSGRAQHAWRALRPLGALRAVPARRVGRGRRPRRARARRVDPAVRPGGHLPHRAVLDRPARHRGRDRLRPARLEPPALRGHRGPDPAAARAPASPTPPSSASSTP